MQIPDHRVPYTKGVIRLFLEEMLQPTKYARTIGLQGMYLMLTLKVDQPRIIKCYDIPPKLLYQQRLAMQRTPYAAHLLTECATPIIPDYLLAYRCIYTMGTMTGNSGSSEHPILASIAFNLNSQYALMAEAHRNVPLTLDVIGRYRLTIPELPYLLGIKYLAPWRDRLHLIDHTFPPHKIPYLNRLGCTSGELMNLYQPEGSLLELRDFIGIETQDLYYRLLFAPYDDHNLMFDAEAYQTKETRLPWLGVHRHTRLTLDQLGYIRNRMYPYYEELTVEANGELYHFPEGRRRSFLELATDPRVYKALENDEINVVDIAHMQGMGLAQFKHLMIDLSMYISNWGEWTNNKHKADFDPSLESFYKMTAMRPAFKDVETFKMHYALYISEVFPFCKLYMKKFEQLMMELFAIYGKHPTDTLLAMHRWIHYHSKKHNNIRK